MSDLSYLKVDNSDDPMEHNIARIDSTNRGRTLPKIITVYGDEALRDRILAFLNMEPKAYAIGTPEKLIASSVDDDVDDTMDMAETYDEAVTRQTAMAIDENVIWGMYFLPLPDDK